MTNYLPNTRNLNSVLFTAMLIALFLMLPQISFAHESWLLTPEQIIEWNTKPKPEIFSQLTYTNIFMMVFAIFVFYLSLWLEKNDILIFLKKAKMKVTSYEISTPLIIRLTMAVMFIMAIFGLNPKYGTELYEASTLLAPDLELRILDGSWVWLAWAQGLAALTLIAGIYVRFTALIILLIDIVGIIVFGYSMWAYAGILAASSVFLLFQGAGTFSFRAWIPKETHKIVGWLEGQSSERSQFLLRILTGLNFLYLGVEYKFLQPNLSMAFLEIHDVFTFGLEHSVFTFLMFLVESLAGILLIMGVLIRPLTFILFSAFIFLGFITGENPIGHIIIYGIFASFLINGKGLWSSSEASETDNMIGFDDIGGAQAA